MSIKTTLHATAPLLSVGAICFTSSGSNGGCWVLLVPPPPLFFLEKGVFFPYATYTKKIFVKQKCDLCQKEAIYTLISTIELCFPPLKTPASVWRHGQSPHKQHEGFLSGQDSIA